jgi:spore coat polysaccharide biosynthesis protein SpsF
LTLKTIAIIQARMSSNRLPGKVLLDIGGQSMLVRVVTRARRARLVDQVVVATTSEASDDAVAALCAQSGYACYRGSQHDVLDRYFQAACRFGGDVIVRLTADCPVIDPGVVDHTLAAFFGMKADRHADWHADRQAARPQRFDELAWDFAANRLPPPWGRTYPIGLDTEVCTFLALRRAWQEASLPYQREHVMPYLYDTPGRFRVLLVNHEQDYGALRWTVDTPEDLEVLRRIYAAFAGRDDFSWLEVLDLFRRHPDLAHINAQVHHKGMQEVDQRRE